MGSVIGFDKHVEEANQTRGVVVAIDAARDSTASQFYTGPVNETVGYCRTLGEQDPR